VVLDRPLLTEEAIDVQPLEATRVAHTDVRPPFEPPPPPAFPPPLAGPTPPPPLAGPTPPPPAPKPDRPRSHLGRLVVSAALLAIGLLAVTDLLGADIPAGAYLTLPLIVVGAGLVLGAWYGRAHALIALGAALSIALAITSAADNSIGRANGTTTWHPTGFEQLDSPYTIGIGNARLDLSSLDFTGRTVAVQVSVDVGNLTLLLPANVDATIQASVDLGNAQVFDQQWGGINQTERTITDNGADGPGGGQLNIRATVDVGDLEVRR
jgi:hypothetical protein